MSKSNICSATFLHSFRKFVKCPPEYLLRGALNPTCAEDILYAATKCVRKTLDRSRNSSGSPFCMNKQLTTSPTKSEESGGHKDPNWSNRARNQTSGSGGIIKPPVGIVRQIRSKSNLARNADEILANSHAFNSFYYLANYLTPVYQTTIADVWPESVA